MTTVMWWGNSDGLKGRCDAKCHEATEPECDCMCGGQFHGCAGAPGGLKGAIDEHWATVFEGAREEARLRGFTLLGDPTVTTQMELGV